MNSEKIRQNRTICIPFDEDLYNNIVRDAPKFRQYVEMIFLDEPQLFPQEMSKGFQLKEIRPSIKACLSIRRILVRGTSYSIRPSFMTPYLTARVRDVEDPLLLRKYGVPFWVIAKLFGRDPMFWHRMERTLGRFSLVGTTIQDSKKLPEYLLADEKHSKLGGEKAYVATTVANDNECILGASVAEDATAKAFEKAYGVFKGESRKMDPGYSPETVNTDGFQSTRKAWKALFPLVTILSCFLHVFIKLRDGTKKKFKATFLLVATKLWDCYKAENKGSFSQRVRRLCEWAKAEKVPEVMQKRLKKLRSNRERYAKSYDHPGAYRTSNMLDRLMRGMDRHLFDTVYFHGGFEAAELSIRGWALVQNFAPQHPCTVELNGGALSRAERLNGKRYHDSWLQNLLISASLGGYRSAPPKT